MKKQTIFDTIRNQIVKNELEGLERKFTISNEYPEAIIVWLTTKQKAFKVKKVTKKYDKTMKYTIEYDNVLTTCDFLDTKYESEKYKKDSYNRKGLNLNEAPSTKTKKLNDIYRYELECPNWNSTKDETGYCSNPFNKKGFEPLDKSDDCSFELFLQLRGYENYNDFINIHELSPKSFQEQISNEYEQWRNNNTILFEPKNQTQI